MGRKHRYTQTRKSCILKAFRIAEYDGIKYRAMSHASEILPTDNITDAIEPQPTQAMTGNTHVTIKLKG